MANWGLIIRNCFNNFNITIKDLYYDADYSIENSAALLVDDLRAMIQLVYQVTPDEVDMDAELERFLSRHSPGHLAYYAGKIKNYFASIETIFANTNISSVYREQFQPLDKALSKLLSSLENYQQSLPLVKLDSFDRSLQHIPEYAGDRKQLPEGLTTINFETSSLKAETLYGVFFKLIHNSDISINKYNNRLMVAAYEMTLSKNKVLLIEWQTRQARKLQGQNCFKINQSMLQDEKQVEHVYFVEKEFVARKWLDHDGKPVIVQGKPVETLTYLQYQTMFAPTKKRHLKVPHLSLDNRRAYLIYCPKNFTPIYEIWTMEGGPNPQNKSELVFANYEYLQPAKTLIPQAVSSSSALSQTMQSSNQVSSSTAVMQNTLVKDKKKSTDDLQTPLNLLDVLGIVPDEVRDMTSVVAQTPAAEEIDADSIFVKNSLSI